MQPLHHQTRYIDVELGGAPEQTEILRNQSLAHFAINPKTLDCILDANNIDFLGPYGGVEGIGSALESHLERGIKGDDQDLRLRHEVFGSNLFDEDGDHQLELSEAKSYFKLAFESFKEPTTILLLCCATLSVLLGVLKDGTQSEWCDGAMMFILVLVSFIVKLYKERAHRRMLTIAKNNLKVVDVIRDGNPQKIPASQVTVGEIVILKTGDRVSADGLFKGSSSFMLDDVENEDPTGMDYNRFPAIHAGTEVAVGDCRMIVISVGKNSRWSKMMNHNKSQWLFNVDKLSANMEKIMLGLSLVLLVVQLLCYFLKKTNNNGISIKRNLEETKSIMNTSMEELINDVTIVFKKNTGIFSRLIAILGVVLMGVREGLNLGIFTNFRCSKRKLKIDHQAIVTNLPSFAGLGLVTTIYTCETADLALNKTSKADLWIGEKIVKEATTELTHELLDTLREGVGHLTRSGPFKDPLLCWAKLFLGVKMEELVQSFTILHNEEEASIDGNCHGLSLRRNGDNQKNIIHMHWSGDSKIVLPMCSHFYSVDGQQNYIDENQRMNLEKISEQIASDCNPYEEDLKPAVKTCREAGVNITLILNQDKNTATFMGINSGVVNPTDDDISKAIVEASEIRNILENDESHRRSVSDIRVLTNSSPSDKLRLIQYQRRQQTTGEVIAVTGRRAGDSQAFNEADITFWIGDSDSKVAAKESSSDIIMLNRSLESIVAVIKRGRLTMVPEYDFVVQKRTRKFFLF
ncbi:calcium-transporting ATPase 12, plasma membrane-type-like [Camellia sinensis]|uniref:calcium-transporting ATPase 12, plasma membrane-type-like n=1 Tax=Camellia sinensis TaxID=4442 RepID=UPI0010360748|nr:calcium-transporting ATPase 12, plasma membrane-type-like [Camellia sinensis]